MSFPHDMTEINRFGQPIEGPQIMGFVLEKQKMLKEQREYEEWLIEREERQQRWAKNRKQRKLRITKNMAIILAALSVSAVCINACHENTDPKNILNEEYLIHNNLGEYDGYHINPELSHGHLNKGCDLGGLTLEEYAKKYHLENELQDLEEKYNKDYKVKIKKD